MARTPDRGDLHTERDGQMPRGSSLRILERALARGAARAQGLEPPPAVDRVGRSPVEDWRLPEAPSWVPSPEVRRLALGLSEVKR
ncbi:MAG: hypothetical protein AMXMBFR64_61790 [Myxococcales bacterium]